MNVSRGVLCGLIAFLLVSLLPFVLAEEPPGFDQLPFANQTQQLERTLEEEQWDYLSGEWRNYFINETRFPRLFAFDERMTSISPVFFVLFGQDYSFSWTFFVTLLLWITFSIVFIDAIALFSLFSLGVSIALGVIFGSLSGHLGIYRLFADGIFRFFFTEEGFWSWLGPLLFVVVCLISVVIFRRVFRIIKKARAQGAKKNAESKQKTNQDVLDTTVKVIDEASAS